MTGKCQELLNFFSSALTENILTEVEMKKER